MTVWVDADQITCYNGVVSDAWRPWGPRMREWIGPQGHRIPGMSKQRSLLPARSDKIVQNQGTHQHMIYTEQEHEWLSAPKKRRVSNQTRDGSAPRTQDYRKHDWAITTTMEVDGKIYVMPVQV